MQSIKELLSEVKKIIDKSEEEARINGEFFNIFSILKLTTKEVKLHSRLLAELMNPRGSHQMNDIFLKHFIAMLNEKHPGVIPYDFNTSNALVEVEKHIDRISDDGKNGGRIDLLISDQKHAIAIENKIFATDKENQLLRYYNHNKTDSIFYLTLNGESPNDQSSADLTEGEDFHLISYRIDIFKWLNDCLKEIKNHPVLENTLKQYIATIKRLTGQLYSEKMNNELKDKIKENLDTAIQINHTLNEVKYDVLEEFRQEILEFLKSTYKGHTLIEKIRKARDIKHQFAAIFVELKNSNFVLGIEPFSGIRHKLFVGLLDFAESPLTEVENKKIEPYRDEFKHKNVRWKDRKHTNYNLQDLEIIRQLDNPPEREIILSEITGHIKEYIDKWLERLS